MKKVAVLAWTTTASKLLINRSLPDTPWVPCYESITCYPQPEASTDPEAANFCKEKIDGFYVANKDCSSYFYCLGKFYGRPLAFQQKLTLY